VKITNSTVNSCFRVVQYEEEEEEEEEDPGAPNEP